MAKNHSSHSAFTLIEVMVAVMIVSIVIAALLEMRGGTSHKLFELKKMMQSNQYSSFLLSSADKYGFEESKLDMQRFVENFNLESDLRRKLKAIKSGVEYEELESIDTSELEESDSEEVSSSSGIVLEIGRTTLKSEEFSSSLVRVRLQ